MVKKSDKEILQTKTDKIMNTVAERCAYYRANPSQFIELIIPSLKLKWYQKIILWAFNHYDMALFVASRGLSKSMLIALFCVYKCILYPHSHVGIFSHTFKQGKEVILKITDNYLLNSPLLRNEIQSYSTGQNDCAIRFKNGSWMRVGVSGENSLGLRTTVVCVDEMRLVSQLIIDKVIRPMNSAPRSPGYLNKPEYAHLKEVPQEYYLSSAYYCQSELFNKAKAYTANMLTDNLKYFVCDLPYQLSIREGILLRQTIENEMSESTFSDITFSMERGGLFYGSSEDALFTYKMMSERRILNETLLPLEYYRVNNLKVPDKKKNELRILSVDVALMASKKHDNDASTLLIHSATPTSAHRYMDNLVYVETQEGLITDELGLLIMRYFYQYNCDYLVLDTVGNGLSIYDFMMTDRYDPLYGVTYPALSCINNPEMAERCKVKGAPKKIWAIKTNAQQNNIMLLALRNGLQNGDINLLVSDDIADLHLPTYIKGFNKLSDNMQTLIRLPYIQTTFLINEMINLEHDIVNGLIKVHEKTGMRKDRYSSFEYGYWVIQELNKNLKPKPKENKLVDKFVMKQPQLRQYGLMA